MLTVSRLVSVLIVLRDEHELAAVFPDWDNREACVLSLEDLSARDEVAAVLHEYWPTLSTVWPEELDVETIVE